MNTTSTKSDTVLALVRMVLLHASCDPAFAAALESTSKRPGRVLTKSKLHILETGVKDEDTLNNLLAKTKDNCLYPATHTLSDPEKLCFEKWFNSLVDKHKDSSSITNMLNEHYKLFKESFFFS